MVPLGFDEWSGKLCNYIYLFIINTNKKPGKEIHKARCGRVPTAGAPVSLELVTAPAGAETLAHLPINLTCPETQETLSFGGFYGDFITTP